MLDAALHLFADRGYHGTAVPEIAARAGVGMGTLYRSFSTKEALVNAVFCDAKARLGEALLNGLDLSRPGAEWFSDLWSRLIRFARREPLSFRFLEMQDHTAYLDEASKRVELTVLGPIVSAGHALLSLERRAKLPVDAAIALIWGAFVGLIKAERNGYLALDETTLVAAGKACWEIIAPHEAPHPPRTTSRKRSKTHVEHHRDDAPPHRARPRSKAAR